jgi:glucose-1-phosphate thymidylyltransferase
MQKTTKGIVLAGGKGTRLYPLTHTISKQLLPVYNKPMIYYPLQTLRSMGITDILIITADEIQARLFQSQLYNCHEYNLNITYAIQGEPRGLADAFIIGEQFIGDDDVVLILGDNVFIEHQQLHPIPNSIYTYKVKNPTAYGVVSLVDGKIDQIEEKPSRPLSDDAVVGLYCFNSNCVKYAKNLKPSYRQELEIIDLIRIINDEEGVNVIPLDGFWFDCGTHKDLLECANLVEAIENRANRRIGLHL